MTMTREEAIIREAIEALYRLGRKSYVKDGVLHWELTADYWIAVNAEVAMDTIAALSAQEQEPWGWEWVDGSDTGVVTLRQDYEKYKRDYPRMTFTALYAAPPAQADTKQAAIPADVLDQFEDKGAANVLRVYLKLHEGKIGAHWLWCVIGRMAAGEREDVAMRDYGYYTKQAGHGEAGSDVPEAHAQSGAYRRPKRTK